MTIKIKIIPILAIILVGLIFSSCGEGSTDRLTAAQIKAYEDYVMSSYFMLRGDASIAESRAAWDYTKTVAFPTGDTPATSTSNNYPEKGQKTTVTITKTDVINVYLVENVTRYPKRDSITSTTESYYVLDKTDALKDPTPGTYNATVDPICTSTGVEDPLARKEFVTLFDNGLKRNEKILAVGGTGGSVYYADFDINDSLYFPNPDDPLTFGGGSFSGNEWIPGPAADTSRWSSKVAYKQELSFDIWFWTYTQIILGTRYYTENADDVRSSVTYERTIATTSQDQDLGEFLDWLKRFFEGRNTSNTGSAADTTYTETVIRTRIEGNKKKQVKSSTAVYDEAGASVVTFDAIYEEDENGVVTNSGAPVAKY